MTPTWIYIVLAILTVWNLWLTMTRVSEINLHNKIEETRQYARDEDSENKRWIRSGISMDITIATGESEFRFARNLEKLTDHLGIETFHESGYRKKEGGE